MRWWRPWRTRPDALPGARRAPISPRVRRLDRALAAAVALLTAVLYLSGLFERLELIAIDHRYRAFPAPPRADILLVLIDADSLRRPRESLDPWPWPRSVHARLLRALSAAGARAIGYDVELGTRRDPAGDAQFLAAVAESGRVVLPVFYEIKEGPRGVRVLSATPLPEALRKAGAAAGTIGVPSDVAGGIRRSPLQEDVRGDPHWAFGVEVARVAEGLPPDDVRWGGSNLLRLGGRSIQADKNNIVYIDYVGGPDTFPHVSAADVLEGRVPQAALRGKVVLVGASAIELHDLRPTPFPNVMPGVEIQANLVNGFLRGTAARRLPPWTSVALLAFLAAAWPRLAARVARGPARVTTRALRIMAAAACFVIAFAAAAAILFWHWRLFLDVVPLVVAVMAMGVASTAVESVRTGRRAALSTVALVPAGPGAGAGAWAVDQAVDILFAGLRAWMRVDVFLVELAGGARRPGSGPLVRTASMAGLGPASAACGEWGERARSAAQGLLLANLGEVFVAAPGAAAVRAAGSAFVPLRVGDRLVGVLQAHRAGAPFEAEDLRVLEALGAQLALTVRQDELAAELRALYLGTMATLADAMEARDASTGGHCQRVSDYAVRLAQAAGLSPAEVEEVRIGSLIHDIGKISIPDSILGKPGALTPEERRQVEQHTLIGERILAQVPISQTVRDVILYHHERYDGGGYPRGLAAEAIPVAARVLAVVDTYEAIIGGRVYSPARPEAEARRVLREAAGTQLDPRLVGLFLQVLEAEAAGEGAAASAAPAAPPPLA